MSVRVLILNGPNLDQLAMRDSSLYGDMSYPQLVEYINKAASENGFTADIRQSNDEAEIISWLHEAAMR